MEEEAGPAKALSMQQSNVSGISRKESRVSRKDSQQIRWSHLSAGVLAVLGVCAMITVVVMDFTTASSNIIDKLTCKTSHDVPQIYDFAFQEEDPEETGPAASVGGAGPAPGGPLLPVVPSAIPLGGPSAFPVIPAFPSVFPSAFPSGAPGPASSVCLAPDCTDAQNEFNTMDGDASTCITWTEMSSSPNGLLYAPDENLFNTTIAALELLHGAETPVPAEAPCFTFRLFALMYTLEVSDCGDCTRLRARELQTVIGPESSSDTRCSDEEFAVALGSTFLACFASVGVSFLIRGAVYSFLTSVWWSKDGLYKKYRTGLFSYVCALTCIVPCFLYWWYFTVEGVYVTLAAISASSLALLLHAVPPGQVELLRVTTFHTGKTMNLAFVDGSCKHDVTSGMRRGITWMDGNKQEEHIEEEEDEEEAGDTKVAEGMHVSLYQSPHDGPGRQQHQQQQQQEEHDSKGGGPLSPADDADVRLEEGRQEEDISNMHVGGGIGGQTLAEPLHQVRAVDDSF
ncbi:unnamed protein product [Vitrella brassicaformis CCMP3155]|uniref:Transmembrane protein n=1 Tax=Vitrella brassicaformis (strain CCMP3155) TaxID=1169540 RepID=A0A0G4ELB2_VITBC|nr:unnamed protein product [Vitrella brassicaformis CCMP3155]|eukprot:CEL98202.1 unnamed protein product [Vitrella brassicaformis CCMP3155]